MASSLICSGCCEGGGAAAAVVEEGVFPRESEEVTAEVTAFNSCWI